MYGRQFYVHAKILIDTMKNDKKKKEEESTSTQYIKRNVIRSVKHNKAKWKTQ